MATVKLSLIWPPLYVGYIARFASLVFYFLIVSDNITVRFIMQLDVDTSPRVVGLKTCYVVQLILIAITTRGMIIMLNSLSFVIKSFI